MIGNFLYFLWRDSLSQSGQTVCFGHEYPRTRFKSRSKRTKFVQGQQMYMYTLILQQFNFKDASLPKGVETLYNLILQPLYTVRYAAVSISIESGIVLYLFEIQGNCF